MLIRTNSDLLAFGVDIMEDYLNNKLKIIYTTDIKIWQQNNKTQIVKVNDSFFDSYGVSIGIKWFIE